MVNLQTLSMWGAIIAAGTGLLLLLFAIFDTLPRILKHYIPPVMSVKYAYPHAEDIHPDGVIERLDDTLKVRPEKPVGFEVVVEAKYFEYTPTQIDFDSQSGHIIKEFHLFTDDTRWWEEPYPGPDIWGDF